jgi:alpha-glucosidase
MKRSRFLAQHKTTRPHQPFEKPTSQFLSIAAVFSTIHLSSLPIQTVPVVPNTTRSPIPTHSSYEVRMPIPRGNILGSSHPDALAWLYDHAPRASSNHISHLRDPRETKPAEPFPAYTAPLTDSGPLNFPAPFRPRFARDGRIALIALDLPPGTALYATGEQPGPLRRDGTCRTLWNTDSFDYEESTAAIYQSHPFILALLPDGSSLGIIIETTRRVELDLRKGLLARVDLSDAGHLHAAPSPVVTIFHRSTPQAVVETLGQLTGTIPLPPMWALGYHQCRWSYEPESQVREIAKGFRDRQIPCDVIWLDIDYMDGFRCFTTDPTKFPDMKALVDDLHAEGFKVISMIDPGLKTDPEYHAYAQGHAQHLFVRNAEGNEYHGEVWPGDCAFPDYTNIRTRQWWAGLYNDFMKLGFDGVWNDMNEPAVFKVHSKTMPESNLHHADPELGGPGTHARYHNIYGMQMARATREGIAAAVPDKRPFVLTRANFLGGQRFAAMWTGDNAADWRHFRWSINMAINMGLSAQPLAGPDIGGFKGNSEPELFARWMAVGALLPFARGHKVKDARMHEPWELGPRTEAICKAALERRYRLLPYLYTLFHEASRTGLPVIRPAFFANTTDARLRSAEDLFLLGDALLVRANLEPVDSKFDASHSPAKKLAPVNASLNAMVGGATIEERPALKLETPSPTPLPPGTWRVWDQQPDQPELFVKAGHILPVGPTMQWHNEKPLDPLTLIISLDDQGQATGTFYEDANDGHAYLQGDYRLTTFHAQLIDGQLKITTNSEGQRPAPKRTINTIIL